MARREFRVIRKVPCDSVPFGDLISTNDEWVWAAYDNKGNFVCIAATGGRGEAQV